MKINTFVIPKDDSYAINLLTGEPATLARQKLVVRIISEPYTLSCTDKNHTHTFVTVHRRGVPYLYLNDFKPTTLCQI